MIILFDMKKQWDGDENNLP